MADDGSLELDEKESLILTESDDLSTENELESDSDDHKHEQDRSPGDDNTPSSSQPAADTRFHPPTPSHFKRSALITITLLLLWVAFSSKKSLWSTKQNSKVIYASRYSKEHKFRPAASPIITETLKDGRIRIRGAGPTATPTPLQPTTPIAAKKPKKRAKPKSKPKVKKTAKRKKLPRRS